MPRGDRPEEPPEWTFLDLLKRGLVEYVDVNEENDCLVRHAPCNTPCRSCYEACLLCMDITLPLMALEHLHCCHAV